MPSFLAERSASGEVVRRELTSTSTADASNMNGSSGTTTASSEPSDLGRVVTPENFPVHLRAHFDLIVDLLEQRIITQLERRGGRYRGDF